MPYELYIYPAEGARQTTTAQNVIDAFATAGIPSTEQTDEFGHWVVLDGFESSLNLTVTNGIMTGAGFRYAGEDDESVIEKVAEVFKSLGWLVSDDEGTL